MELCVDILGVSFFLIQATLALVLLIFVFPLIAVKIAAKFKFKSVNWIIIGAGIELYCIRHIYFNNGYINFFSDYLPAVVCGFFL